jgi:hypothetical protein
MEPIWSRRDSAHRRVEIGPEIVYVLDANTHTQERGRKVMLSWNRRPAFYR